MARLATHIWVSAYLQRLMANGVYAHVMHRGDDTAGALAVKLSFMDGRATLYMRATSIDGRLVWDREIDGAPEVEVDAVIERRRGRDRDLWVIEVEDPRGRHMLDEPGLAE